MSKLSYYYEMGRKTPLLRNMPRIWNYIKYRSLPRKANMSIKRYTPQIANLIVSKRCNLSCDFCCIGKELNPKGWRNLEATLEKIQQIFANPLFSNCLMVDLLGGEPLLVLKLDSIVAWLSKRGHIINTSTNGLNLLKRISDLKRAGISRINISLYDENQSVLERDLTEINKIFPVHTSIVLERSVVENEQDKLLEKARFIHDAGCLSLRVWIYRPMGIEPKAEETIDNTLPAYIEFQRRMEESLPGFCVWPTTVQAKNVKKRCTHPWQRIFTDMQGNMGICCGSDMKLQGFKSNLFDCEPDVLFNHPTLVNIRKQLLDPISEPPNMCKNCNLLGEPGW